MVVLVIPKNEEDPIKNEAARVATTFSPLKLNGSYLLLWTPEFRSDLLNQRTNGPVNAHLRPEIYINKLV